MLKSGKVVVDAMVWSVLLGRNVQTTHDSVAEAKAWQSSQRLGRFHGQEIDLRGAKQSFAATAAEWLATKPSKGVESRKTDRNRLIGTGARLRIEGEGKSTVVTVMGRPTGFAAIAVGRITRSDVQRLVDEWCVTHRPSSVQGMYSSTRAVFAYAERKNVIPRSPCRDITLPILPKVQRPVLLYDDADLDDYVGSWAISNDDLIALADALGPDYGLMVWIAVYLGMRWQEIAGLTVSSLDLLQGQIKVEQALTRQQQLKGPKTLAGNRYFVDRELTDDFAAHLARRGLTAADGGAFLFLGPKGGALNYSSWRRYVWLPALPKAGLDRKRNGRHLGVHDLRSMNASIMDHEGVDATTARFRRGHSSGDSDDRMDDVYTRSSARQNRLASEKIGAVLRRHPRAENA
jgi:integrase